MNRAVFTTIAATGFGVAFFHAAIPTHWLPFVLASRAQKWGRAKTLLVTALAGAGHVLFTTLLGVLVVWLGIGLSRKAGAMFPLVAGWALVLFAGFCLIRQFSSGGHGHIHLFGKGHSHAHTSHDHHSTGIEHDHGKHGGTLVNLGHGFVEVSIFETNVPPRFRLYFSNPKRIPLSSFPNARVTIETVRPDGHQDEFHFEGCENYLESTSNIPEPHEFHARLRIAHGDHVHEHEIEFVEHDHDHAQEPQSTPSKTSSDWVAIGSLFALLTFSPCEGFLPVYLTGISSGWFGFALLSVILAGATLAGMVLFTWLTLLGLEKLKLQFFEKYETGILGGLLCLLGLLIMLFEK